EQFLAFQAAQEGVQRVFIDGEAAVRQRFRQGVAVIFGAELGQHGQHQAAAAQLQTEVFEKIWVHERRTKFIYRLWKRVCGTPYRPVKRLARSSSCPHFLPGDRSSSPSCYLASARPVRSAELSRIA